MSSSKSSVTASRWSHLWAEVNRRLLGTCSEPHGKASVLTTVDVDPDGEGLAFGTWREHRRIVALVKQPRSVWLVGPRHAIACGRLHRHA
jgi:hypothetical protein